MTGTEFRSTFHVHDKNHNKLFSETSYSYAYGRNASLGPREEAQQIEDRNSKPAGVYNPLKADSMKLVTTMYCENQKKSTLEVIQPLT
jgi:hypothetical protein